MNSEELAVKIGKAIKLKRLISDLSRSELANISGVKHLTIQRMENGQGSAIGLDNLLPILDALNIDISELLKEIRYPINSIPQDKQKKNETILQENLFDALKTIPGEQKVLLEKLISTMAVKTTEEA